MFSILPPLPRKSTVQKLANQKEWLHTRIALENFLKGLRIAKIKMSTF